MNVICSHCQSTLTGEQDEIQCPKCHTCYRNTAYCPDCQTTLQVLKACGAVDFFCQQHGLISSSRVVWRPEVIES
ncbi:YfgJ family double zinc ribbon protein [Tatumella citrea]|uniref:YfgJ family double zinc ribbon protein n=1 Tax=Tatumella citrea TaxID=53336 RepID=UPI000B3C8A91|nr:zinc-ribbon domain-containing protein [Tatumella citrea]